MCLTPLRKVAKRVCEGTLRRYFSKFSGCFVPFVDPGRGKRFDAERGGSIVPRRGRKVCTIPRVLAGGIRSFLYATGGLKSCKCGRIGLGLKYPSEAIIAGKEKTKFLSRPRGLSQFLSTIFRGYGLRVSVGAEVKVRSPRRFRAVLPVCGGCPLGRLVVRPHIRGRFCGGAPGLSACT